MGNHSGEQKGTPGEGGNTASRGQDQGTESGHISHGSNPITTSEEHPGKEGSREYGDDTRDHSGNEKQRSVQFEINGELLRGTYRKPPEATGIVVLVSGGCGISQSHREVQLTDRLFENSIATFSVDLLTPKEASQRKNRRNIDLLTERIALVTNWLKERTDTDDLDIGYYGTDTGGSAVLQFERYGSVSIQSIVLFNGRPDLSNAVTSVPILCAVDEDREFLMEANEEFYDKVKESRSRSEFLRAEDGMKVIPQMAHWFSESFR
jgi:dienelactone hydrolase